MNQNATDHELLAAYLQGSQDAFRVLVDRYIGLIYATASRAADPSLAEDITQAVFILLANRAHSLRNPQLLPAWLLKVTHYCAADARRAASRRKKHEQKAAAMATSFTTDTSQQEPLESHLDSALQSLSPPDRSAILLRFYNDNSLTQIAASLDISEEAAKKRVARALQKLRKLFLRQGLPLALPLLATTLAKQASAAPPALTTKIAAAALAKSTTATSATLIAKGALKLMTYTTAKWTAATTAAALLLITITAAELTHTHPTPPSPTPIAQAAPPVATEITTTPITSSPSSFSQLPPTGPAPTIEVLDLATHQPLEGVQIELSTDERNIPSNTGTTNAAGTISLPLPPTFNDSLSILATKDGFVPAQTYTGITFPNDKLPQKITLQLEKATTIGGKVVDDQGTPLASALVEVIIMKQYKNMDQTIPWNIRATTNAQGEWTINALPEQCDTIHVGAFHKSCISPGSVYGPETSIPDLRNRTAVTTLKRGTPLHAAVRAPDGKPVKAWIGISDQRISSNAVPEFPTSDDGQFDIVSDAGQSFFVVHAPGYAPQVVQYKSADPQPLLITLEPATPLNVRIFDTDGHPVENAILTPDYYLSKEGRYSRPIDAAFISNHDGQISWPDCFSQQLFVNVSARGLLSQSDVAVTPGQTNTITLLRRSVIHVAVIDDDTHQPAKDFHILEGYKQQKEKRFQYAEFSGSGNRPTGPGAFDYTFTEQQDQRVLRILGGEYTPTDSDLIPIDGQDHSLTIHVSHGERLTGTLLDAAGSPLANTQVFLQTTWLDIYDAKLPTDSSPTIEDHDHFALTDAGGQFSFPPQDNTYTLMAGNDNGYVIVKSKTFINTNTLKLIPWAKVEGTLLTSGKPTPNTPVNANLDNPPFRDRNGPFCHFTTTTDANGHFTYPKVFAGHLSFGPQSLTTKPGQTSTITLETTTP